MQFASFPSYASLMALLERLVRENGQRLRCETIGKSAAGKDVLAVHVAGENGLPEEKEVVFIICGRHGDEIGTRVVGPAIIRWLMSAEAAPILARQHLVVVPIANPDGCERGVFGLPPDRLSRLEAETVLRLADRYIPDLVIDVHSVGREKHGHDWGGLQAVVIDAAADAGEDRHIAFKMALQTIEDARAQGELFLLHDVSFYRNLASRAGSTMPAAFNNHLNRACYDRFHSLNFGVEVNHFVMTPDAVARSATVAIRALLEQGNRRFAGERHAGYPNRLLKGDFLSAIRTSGDSPGERRRSRRSLWHGIGAWDLSREMPDPQQIGVRVHCAGDVGAAASAEVSFFSGGRRPPQEVRLNGAAVSCPVSEEACGSHVFVKIEGALVNRKAEIWARL